MPTKYEPRPHHNTLASRLKFPEQSRRLFKKDPHISNVEGMGLSPEGPSTPPAVPTKETKKKRKRRRKSRCERKSEKTAAEKQGGARLVKSTHGGGPGNRNCLARAVVSLLERELKEAFLDDALEVVPAGSDACPADLAPVLARHGLALVRASKDYLNAGGPPWQHVLEDERCSIVLKCASMAGSLIVLAMMGASSMMPPI